LSKVLLLETEKEVFLKINKSGRAPSSFTSIDGEMCNILIAETNKLKGEVESLKQSLGWRENEVKQLKRKIRDSEMESRNIQKDLNQSRFEESSVENIEVGGHGADYRTSELTSKATLRRFVDELKSECGKSALELRPRSC
jgi:hypothetical protein